VTGSAATRGFVVAALHLAIVGSLGGKLLADRTMRPRVWARTAPVDPNLPIRGRYVRLRIEAAATGMPAGGAQRVLLSKDGDRLVATPASGSDGLYARTIARDGEQVAVVDQSLAYFIPEHVPDPSRRQAGEELWVEVTLPRQGAPRPIRLGVKRAGQLTPLQLE
jgi:uncharacterized membrane-anchored protein